MFDFRRPIAAVIAGLATKNRAPMELLGARVVSCASLTPLRGVMLTSVWSVRPGIHARRAAVVYVTITSPKIRLADGNSGSREASAVLTNC